MDVSPPLAGPAGPTDAELVARFLRGHDDAFRELTTRYYRPVSGFLYKRVQRPDVVEDLAQETFLEAFRSLAAGRVPERFGAWLFAIAHHCCGKWLRRKRPVLFAGDDPLAEAAVPSEVDLEAEREEQAARLRALEAGLAGLPPETRRLLTWKHQDGLTCEQIAARLGRPVGTVKSLLSRAYKELRARLGPRGGGRP